jgi:hypothetical protein
MALYVISCALERNIPNYEPEHSALMKTICMSEPETFMEAEKFFKDEFPGSNQERQGWQLKGDPVICPLYKDDIQRWDKYIDERPRKTKVHKNEHLTVIK